LSPLYTFVYQGVPYIARGDFLMTLHEYLTNALIGDKDYLIQ
jgi:hypothetical protein